MPANPTRRRPRWRRHSRKAATPFALHSTLMICLQAGSKPLLSAEPALENYPVFPAAPDSNPGPVQWPLAQHGRPTLTGGQVGGRLAGAPQLPLCSAYLNKHASAGTPAQVSRTGDDISMITSDDSRTRRKNTPGDQSMRRSIQDLVSSIDPNVKIESEVEDVRPPLSL